MKALPTAALLVVSAASLSACVVSPPMGSAQGVTPVGISIGWHGDQYYDGHRYWARDDWMRSHPNDRSWNGQHDERRNADDRNSSRRSGDRYGDSRRNTSESNASHRDGDARQDRRDQ